MRRYMQGTVDRYEEIPEILEREGFIEDSYSTGTAGSAIYLEALRIFPQRDATEPTIEKFRLRRLQNFLIHPYLLGVTWGSIEPFLLLNIPSPVEDVTKLAREAINSAANNNVAEAANSILDLISDQLKYFGEEGLPPIRAVELDSGSILIEWIFDHFRFGFNLEVDNTQSGYFFISDKSTGEIRSSGFLSGLNVEALIRSILVLILNC